MLFVKSARWFLWCSRRYYLF